MPDAPEGYQQIPEEDRKKAKGFFGHGATVAGSGQFDYSIEMYLQGLASDPEAVDAHQALRDVSLKRKASGGKGLGMFDSMKLKRASKDDRVNLQQAEKLLAFDPGNTDHMLWLMQSAHNAGFYDTVMWIGPILFRANTDSPKPDFNKFIALRDIYKQLKQWKLATDACQAAVAMRPDDMDLVTELKNLGAQHTMAKGNYGTGGSFRDSIKDMDAQRKLLEQDMDVRSDDILTRQIREAEAELKAQPEETGKIMKLVELLVKTEKDEEENRAIDLLSAAFERTKQFRFRLAIGKIKLLQLGRADRKYRENVAKSPNDEAMREEFRQFLNDKAEEELREFTLWAENYPTDLLYKYEMAKRLFILQRYQEAIPVFQTARQDPKMRVDASTQLGRAFLEAEFIDEAVDTLRALIEEYQLKGDARSKEMYYWFARSLEKQNDNAAAIKAYSQLAQWDFNYRDVQGRIKRLRGLANPA